MDSVGFVPPISDFVGKRLDHYTMQSQTEGLCFCQNSISRALHHSCVAAAARESHHAAVCSTATEQIDRARIFQATNI